MKRFKIFKNKKGFTLIEIIIVLSILAVIGTTSVVGINTIVNKNKITELDQVENDILTALDIYIETNNEVRDQIYKGNNAVITPIQLLINEGLLDLSDTDIPLDDIKKNYVVTAFMSDTENDFKCTESKDLRTITSWDEHMSKPLYICTKVEVIGGDGGSGGDTYNIINIVGDTKLVLSDTRKYVNYNYNYVKYKDKSGNDQTARLLYIEPSGESFVLVRNGSFGDAFSGTTIPLTAYKNCGCSDTTNSSKCIYAYSSDSKTSRYTLKYYTQMSTVDSDENGNVNIDVQDIKDAVDSGVYGSYTFSNEFKDLDCIGCTPRYYATDWMIGNGMTGVFPSPVSNTRTVNGVTYSKLKNYYKIKLDASCIQIVNGDGTQGNPYILENKCKGDV